MLVARRKTFSQMLRTGTSSLSKWARWGLLATTIAMAAALITTAWSSRRRVEQASEVLLVGQTQTLLRALVERVIRSSELSTADVESFIADNDSIGVRYVEVRVHGSAPLRVGTPAGPVPNAIAEWRGPPHKIVRVGPRVRVVGRPPPRRRGGGRRPRPGDRGRTPAVLFILEFEPVIGNRLQEDASRSFVVSSAVAGALLLVAGVLWQLLRQRERAEARVEQERRLAMLGEMSAVLAHEIRNPLASLKGHAQLLSEQLEATSPHRRKADRVVYEAERIEALSGALLDFVRTGSIRPESVSPAEVVSKSAESIDASVEIDASEAPRTWSLDPLRMQQVFTNLFDNAKEHSGPTQPVSVRIATERGSLTVTVRDRGPGIVAGQEERVFEAFHTTRTRGVGLGLAVARRIVELHGGTLTASNHPQGGAVFRVSIPREA